MNFKTTFFIISLFLSISFSYGQTFTFEQFKPGQSRPKPNEIKEYVASNGESFKLGQIVTLNQPSGKSNQYQYVLKDVIGQMYPVTTDGNGLKGEIIKFKVYGVSKKAGWEAVAIIKPGDGFRYPIEIEQALEFKEIESSILSREEAIAKLKEAKDLLDLEMMSQEEYDKIKAELTPIIMGGK
ncbi:hypothetical protein OAA74_03710 [Flavobacteriaceae bacterium]|nr:hypothetical protein [Flavobacteriaceae bacterium]